MPWAATLPPTPRPHPMALPGQCELCRRWSRSAGGALCGPCVQQFARPALRCGRCGLRMGPAAATCGTCQRDPPPFSRCVVACDYAFPWSGLVMAWKFQGRLELSAALAERLAAAVRAGAAGAARVDVVVPVPITAARRVERGYNQAWEMARRVAASLGLPARADMIDRVLDAPAQAALSRRERLANLRAAFIVPARARAGVRDREVALVDDVLTTGATAAEATHALLRAGARSVQLWALARTPAPTEPQA